MDFLLAANVGVESFSKLGDSIYFEQEGRVPVLYIIQYISSTYNWKHGQVSVNQNVDPVVSWDPNLRMALTFSSKRVPATAKLSYLSDLMLNI